MAVIKFMEDNMGVDHKSLVDVSGRVHDYLNKPMSTEFQEWLFIPLSGEVSVSIDRNFEPAAGWIIDLTAIRNEMDIYFGVSQPQQELALLASIGSR